MEHEISTRGLNVLWLLILLGAEEVNGCLHGPLNQMAITILNTNRAFSALVIEPQETFAFEVFTKGCESNFVAQSEIFNQQNQLTRLDNPGEIPHLSAPLPLHC